MDILISVIPVLDKPSPPCNLEPTEIGPEAITVVFEPSEDDGGEPITGYIVERRSADKTSWIKVNIFKIIIPVLPTHVANDIMLTFAFFFIWMIYPTIHEVVKY